MRVISGLVLGVVVMTTLSGCGVQPIQQDQPIVLGKGEGVAAIEFKTLDPLSQVFIRPAGSGGKSLEISAVPAGVSLYLFQVPAGHYCFQQFHYGDILFYGQGAELACFQVPAGQLGYSGDLSPLVNQGKVMVHQEYNYDTFRALLKQRYPRIAAQFQPQAAPALAAPAETLNQGAPELVKVPEPKPQCDKLKQLCAWAENATNTRSQTIFIKNNTKWPIRIAAFELYDCINVKEKCGVKQANIKLPAHATKKIMEVDPADPDGAYNYQFRYEYGFDVYGR
ncbi:MAG: hypothetical protein ACRETO_02315 [Gammaproteobacteria bacterium]